MYVPDPRDRHEGQPSLRNDGNDSSHPDTATVPLGREITLANMDHDKREGVNQSKNEHSPSNPVMPDVQLLVRNASQGGDRVRLRT
jgi:hypothetical protein